MTQESFSNTADWAASGELRPPDVELMLDRLQALASYGAREGGAQNRLPYTASDQQVRELFMEWAIASGLVAEMDAVGNVVARMPGRSDLAPVLVGSHLDTQPLGGKYDGIAGSLAALAVAESMLCNSILPQRPLEIVVWAGEEGSGRFDVGCIGSRAMIGALSEEHLSLRCRTTGVSLADAMRACGLRPEEVASVERVPGSIHAVLELHIEQGPYLEEAGIALGVVEAIAGNRRLPLAIRGVQAHSGAQPMTHRRDALTAAAEVILAAETLASEARGPMVATSGMFAHHPRSIAAVPGDAELVVDLRSSELALLLETETELRHQVAEICRRRGVELELEPAWGMDPTRTDKRLVAVLERACHAVGEKHLLMNSGAGHDSLILGKRFPAGLIFVPSRGGLSHCPEEFTSPDDLAKGVHALQAAVLELVSEGE